MARKGHPFWLEKPCYSPDPFGNYYNPSRNPSRFVILMAPSFGAGGPTQLCLQCSCGRRLHRSSGLQKTQAIRMTPRRIHQKLKSSSYSERVVLRVLREPVANRRKNAAHGASLGCGEVEGPAPKERMKCYDTDSTKGRHTLTQSL